MQDDRRAMLSAATGISIVGAGVAVSDHLTDYPVFSAQAVRYAIGAGLLYAVARITGQREGHLRPAEWARLVALALTGMVLFNVAVVRAVTTGEPAVVGTVIGLAPIGLALVVPLLEGRRPQATIVAGAVLAATGAAVVQGFGRADVGALAWSVVALGCEVAFTALAAPLLRTLSPMGLSIRACGLAAVALLATAVVVDGTTGFARPSADQALAVGYLAVASTAVAFVLWYRAVAHLGSDRAGLFAGVMPVSAALVGAAVTSAPLQAGTLLGAVLTGAGLVVGLTRIVRPRLRAAARRPDTDRAPSVGSTSPLALPGGPELSPVGRPPGSCR